MRRTRTIVEKEQKNSKGREGRKEDGKEHTTPISQTTG
jgi:hypothetical protein